MVRGMVTAAIGIGRRSRPNRIGGGVNIRRTVMGLVLLVGLWLGPTLPVASAWGATLSDLPPARPVLTQDLLLQRLNTPIQRDGRPTLNLKNLTIDLRPESPLQADFYRLVKQALQAGQPAPGLDLSYSVIQGDLNLQRLALREPLYGDALFPLLEEAGQAQLKRDRTRLSQLSRLSQSLLIQGSGDPLQIYLFRSPLILVQTQLQGSLNAGDTFLIERILAQGAHFEQGAYLAGARFNRAINLSGSQFDQLLQCRNSIFFDRVRFDQSRFRNGVNFQGAEFKDDANFSQAQFGGDLNFSRVQWQDNADFARTFWTGTAFFLKDTFAKALFFTEARFAAPLILRQARFGEPVNLRNAQLEAEMDLGDALFQPQAYLNVSGMEFNVDQVQILGTPGKIGQAFSVPVLAGNQTLLRNLERNFRRLEQISDANQIAYMAETLRLKDWQRRLTGVNLNTASSEALVTVGFTPAQADAILTHRQDQPFLSPDDLLTIDGVDLAAYVTIKNRVMAGESLSLVSRAVLGLRWLMLANLVVLSHYGTSVGLVFGLGLIATACFSLLFWWVDRYRRRLPTPILPPLQEGLWMAAGCGLLLLLGLSNVLRLADYPWWSLLSLGLLCLPIPLGLIGLLLKQGRFHDLIEQSYFVEDGSMRQLRLLIARLPIIPKFPFFRDRFTPIPLDRRWNWLNYLDFSLNNWLKFGFNDIRLRDQAVPGLITALVWYQWGLGLLYATLLLWTLSRTIPGLNLLIYF